jgi:rhamnulokinase
VEKRLISQESAWQTYYAVDLGASSGRVMIVQTDGRKLQIETAYRFPNHLTRISGHFYWDLPRLLDEVKAGLRKGFEIAPRCNSLAIDTWGTDFGLITRQGSLVGLPLSGRDVTSDEAMDKVRAAIPDEELYAYTGIQFMRVNTLYQLVHMQESHAWMFESAEHLLLLPDLLSFILSGQVSAEYTDASTSHLVDPHTRDWHPELFRRLRLPRHLMPDMVEPGAPSGTLLAEHATDLDIPRLSICKCASHDTASAVAAIPAEDGGQPWAFISSGTWSLVGTELPYPVVTPEARRANATNEGGVNRTVRLLKNVTGLWLLERLRHDLMHRGIDTDYAALETAAKQAPAFARFIHPNYPGFQNPPSMMKAIDEFCRTTGQSPPETPGEYMRCILESLAFAYGEVLETLQGLLGVRFARLHVVGGGCQNKTLCAWTADACGLPVYAGPVEATALGNGLVQAIAGGVFPSLSEARRAVSRSFPLAVYEPGSVETWSQHRERYRAIVRLDSRGLGN